MIVANPNDYCSLADDSAMIQAAVDAAEAMGQPVAIPRRNLRSGKDVWIISRAIELPTGSTILLLDCTLILADGTFSNIFRNTNARTPLGCSIQGRQRDICLRGIGRATLDGGSSNGLTEKTQLKNGLPSIVENTLIHFHNVEGVTVEDIAIRNQRWWGMTFHFCSEGRLSNIRFTAHNDSPNQDGIDLRTGCNRFVIENITGCTGDDTIALTCLDNDFDRPMTVTDLDDSIHSVMIRNISTYVTGRHAIVRLLNHGGKQLYDILIEDIVDRSAGTPYRTNAAVRVGENAYYSESGPAQPGDTRAITIRNVITRARFGVIVSCTLQDALISNIQMTDDGGIGVFFSGCDADNIQIRDVRYSVNGACDESVYDAGAIARFDSLSAIGFCNARLRHVSIAGVTAGRSLASVLGGSGDIEVRLSDIFCLAAGTQTIKGEGIKIIGESIDREECVCLRED